MRAFVISVVVVVIATVACSGGSEPIAPVDTPGTSFGPSALEIWQRVMVALEPVQSVKVRRLVVERTGPNEERALEAVVLRGGGPNNVPLPWRDEEPLPGFLNYSRSPRPLPPTLTNLHLVGTDLMIGQPFWVVAFEWSWSGIDTTDYFSARAWVAQDSYLVNRIEYDVARRGPFGSERRVGIPIVLEYSDYAFAAAVASDATPTPTSSDGSPSTWELEPTTGSCDSILRLKGSGLAPDADVSIAFYLTYITDSRELDGPGQYQSGRANDKGRFETEIELMGEECATRSVAVWRSIWLSIVTRVGLSEERFVLEYRIEPCEEPIPRLPEAGRYCFTP